MELLQRCQRFTRQINHGENSPDDPTKPWYIRKKKTLIFGAVGLFAIVVFLAGFFIGEAKKQSKNENEQFVKVEEKAFEKLSRTDFEAPANWNGVCPQTTAQCPKSYEDRTPILILISIDGLRSDFLNRGVTPTLNKISKCGANADFLYPVFPSKTFPNHFSIVTGVYPYVHGIIDNNMYDSNKRKMYKVGIPEMFEPFWYEREPIWVTAEKQGKKTASFYWPGTDVTINGSTPTYYKEYNAKITFNQRIDQILEWINLPASSRPSLITLYVNQPDNILHKEGVNSPKLNQMLSSVDQMMNRLFSGLQSRNLLNCVNMVIISDHGMSNVNCKDIVDVSKYVDANSIYSTMGAFGRIRNKGRKNDTVVKELISKLKCQSSHMRVYPKEQLPVRMHYADNLRIEPIFLDMDAGWTVVSKGGKPGDGICTGGAHGYDYLFPDMRAIFMAYGGSIKKDITIKPFLNIEIYELLAELAGITPNPNNGTVGSLHQILKKPKKLEITVMPDPPTTAEIPKDEADYENRVSAAGCPACSEPHKQTDIEGVSTKQELHLPFGFPHDPVDHRTLRLLYNEDYVLAFDLRYRIPMWTSFTLTGTKNLSKVDDICWLGDARIPFSDSAKCGDYMQPNVQKQYVFQRPLYSPGFSYSMNQVQATYVTNSIPKSMNHTKVLEKKMNQILTKWANEKGNLNVVMGPAFDLSANGLRPDIGRTMRNHENNGAVTIPTHIFVIATWCLEKVGNLKACATSKLAVQSYLLPNKPFPQNCEPGENIIERNFARVSDIEKLTGISFFTSLPTYDAIRLRTMMPQRSVKS